MATSAVGQMAGSVGVAASNATGVNAWLNCSTVIETVDDTGGAVCHWSSHPTETCAENGTRNFIDANSQSQYRARAEFCRIANVINPTAAVKAVVCHK